MIELKENDTVTIVLKSLFSDNFKVVHGKLFCIESKIVFTFDEFKDLVNSSKTIKSITVTRGN